MRLSVGRFTLVALGLTVAASPAFAQGRGSLALDVMTTPGQHVGIGYYVTDAISLRPRLGGGYSSQYGFSFNAGLDARWELLPTSRLSPYVAAGIDYWYNDGFVRYDSQGVPLPTASPSTVRYGAGAGLRFWATRKLAVVGEGYVMNSQIRSIGRGDYSTRTVQPGAHFEAALGISYTFN